MNDNDLKRETTAMKAPSTKADYVKAIILLLIDIPQEEYVRRIYFLSSYLWSRRK